MQTRSAEDLLQAAERALAARDPSTALALVAQAEGVAGATERSLMLRAVALRASGQLDAALATLDEVLALQPYHFMALLSKGTVLEARGNPLAAVDVYRNVLKIAPPDDRLPPAAARQLAIAREEVAELDRRLQGYLSDAVADLRREHDGNDLRRFDEALDIFAGVKRPHVQEPLLLHYPRLPAIPFHDRGLFPWLGDLEAATDMIAAEMTATLSSASDAELAPYIQFPKGVPVNQWKDLNHSTNWTSFFLWKDGERQLAAQQKCPQTMALLDGFPLCDQPGFAPTAVFSVLQPHTHIPPHTGSTNVRLLVHLPLLLPGPARFRVGNETRDWRMGEAWVFDDTIEHEAWNDADQHRVILILDVWNPLLDEAERALVSRMLLAHKAFRASQSG